MGSIILAALIKTAVMIGMALNLSGLLTWMERRQSAMMQDRLGPVRANLGPLRLKGLVHPIADALKLLFKEDHIPPKAKRWVFVVAPIIALVPVLLVFAVIPFGPTVCIDQLSAVGPDTATCQAEHLQIAHIDIGFLFVFAIASLGVYGAALAGWASFNNYGLLGGMRASAQMLSYEITMGMAVIGAFLVFGTLEPMAVVEQQPTFWSWGIFRQPLGFVLFLFAAIAETKRAPFDIPEGESEIVGYFVEYSGTRFMTFYLGEFLEIVFVGSIVTTLFLGGWQVPGLGDGGFELPAWIAAESTSGLGRTLHGLLFWLQDWPHWLVTLTRVGSFFLKVFVICFLQLAIRWTLPRMRYDQLMRLGWKGMLPASILNVVLTAAVMLVWQAATAASMQIGG
jgi:NADH-quinone oxidoreductase subunit H